MHLNPVYFFFFFAFDLVAVFFVDAQGVPFGLQDMYHTTFSM
jgi:hypothetical protein